MIKGLFAVQMMNGTKLKKLRDFFAVVRKGYENPSETRV